MKKPSKMVSGLIVSLLAVIVLYFVLKTLMNVGIINGYHEGVLVLIGINIIAAASLNLATGYLGQLALGHAGFMAIGAYSAALFVKSGGTVMTEKGFPDVIILIIALVIAGVMAAIVGIIIGIPALRLRGDYLGIVTLGFGEIIRITIFNVPFTNGARGIKGIPQYIQFSEIYVLTIVVLTILYLIIRSRQGRAILSIREDEIAAEAVGVPTTRYKIFGFATSAFFAGIAGAALAFNQRIIDPRKFTFMFSVEIFIIVVLGGMGSLTGTVVAAIILGILNEFLHFIDQWRLVIYALLLVIMMIVRPEGILGTREFSLIGLYRRFFSKQDQQSETT